MSAISLFVPEQISLFLIVPHTNHNQAFEVYSCEENNASLMAYRRTRLKSRQPANCEQGCVCVCVQTETSSESLIITYHFLRLAEIYVFLVLAAWLAFLNVHDADEWHGPASQEEDGEENDDDGGGAN